MTDRVRAAQSLVAAVGVVLALQAVGRGSAVEQALGIGVGLLLAVPALADTIARERWRKVAPRLAAAAFALLIAFVAAELYIRATGTRGFEPVQTVADPALGHRMLPLHGEADGRGWRNDAVPERARVCVLGDSQTYGTNVVRSGAYPQVAGRLSGRSVYQLALGGYGPLQYVTLAELAFELDPDELVVGFFFGNDFVDAHRYCELEPWHALRDPEVDYPALDTEFDIVEPPTNWVEAGFEAAVAHSRVLWRLTYDTKQRMRTSRALTRVHWREPGAPALERGPLATLFTPEYRRRPQDGTRPHVADGMRVTRYAFERLRELCAANDVRLVIFPLPTKEYAYYEHLRRSGDGLAPKLAKLGETELRARELVFEWAGELDLTVVDPLPAILETLAQGVALWPPSSDGHFNAAGCALLGEVLAASFDERGP